MRARKIAHISFTHKKLITQIVCSLLVATGPIVAWKFYDLAFSLQKSDVCLSSACGNPKYLLNRTIFFLNGHFIESATSLPDRLIIIILVIFKCYFYSILFYFIFKKNTEKHTHTYKKLQRCEHIIRKNKQIKSTVHDANKKNEINKDKA